VVARILKAANGGDMQSPLFCYFFSFLRKGMPIRFAKKEPFEIVASNIVID
jgi:hypothetical protein